MSAGQEQGLGNGRQAVVIGGSMAGLVTARVLADYFDQVTIVERDRFATDATPRKGVPQSRQLHVLLVHGLRLYEDLFPNLRADIVAAGGVPVDMVNDFAWLYPQGWNCPSASDMQVVSCTRPVLEAQVYARLAADGRVRFRDACDVVGLEER